MRIAWAVIAAVGLCSVSAQAQDKKAERTWKAKCASCHGADGKGDTDQGKKMKIADMTSADWHNKTTDAKIREAILNGVKTENGEMQSYKDSLSSEQVDSLVNYIHTLKK
ncbi:MAG TPA: cytochrome c [Myxococcales bacterium]|nr:cytochrome c [Myxococcales bacterium]